MPDSPARRTKARAARLYAAGVLAFVALFGLLTLASLFFTHLKT